MIKLTLLNSTGQRFVLANGALVIFVLVAVEHDQIIVRDGLLALPFAHFGLVRTVWFERIRKKTNLTHGKNLESSRF